MIKSPFMGCTLQLITGWSTGIESGKESPKQEALVYSPTRTPHTTNPITHETNYEFDSYPFSTLVTQLRFHGSSRVFKLRYESIIDKDFNLEGYAIEGVSRKEPEADK